MGVLVLVACVRLDGQAFFCRGEWWEIPQHGQAAVSPTQPLCTNPCSFLLEYKTKEISRELQVEMILTTSTALFATSATRLFANATVRN